MGSKDFRCIFVGHVIRSKRVLTLTLKGGRGSVVRTTFVNSREFTLYALFYFRPPSFRISDSRVFTLSLGFTYPPFHRTNLGLSLPGLETVMHEALRRKHSFKNRDLSVLFLSSWIVYPLSSLLFDSFHFFFSYCTCSRKQFGLLSCSW